MNHEFKRKIENLIKDREDSYKDPKDNRIDADYKQELSTNNNYRGRQFFELLQNTDDAKAKEVKITLDSENSILTISNDGIPFSVEGINSLMLAHQSPKDSNKFIGNKGLGFRSIINWADSIVIKTQGLDIAFSRQYAEEKLSKILEDIDFDSIPTPKKMAMLAIPKLSTCDDNQWATQIKVRYLSNEGILEDIKNQLSCLQHEIMLFLINLEKITVSIDNDKKVFIKPNNWEIQERNGNVDEKFLEIDDIDNGRDKFSVKIAFNDELSNHSNDMLFSYFPTKVDINLPLIAHGTFDLNESRNDLILNDKNKFILEQLFDLLIETAKAFKDNCSYKPLELLQYEKSNNTLEELGLYEQIDNAIEQEKIFPCLDRQYRKKSEVIYNNDLSQFIHNNNFNDIFPNLLIPHSDNINFLNEYDLDENINVDNINELNQIITDIETRAEFIYILSNIDLDGKKIGCLVNENNKLIRKEESAYTPTSNIDFKIPSFTKLEFMCEELFNSLTKIFEINEEKSRELQRKLKDFVNIQSYEPATVLQKLITSANKEIEPDYINKVQIIKEMVNCLFHNYKEIDNPRIPEDTKIQLINKQKELSKSQDLYLSSSYPSGKLTEYLFADIYDDSEFLADIGIYDLNDDKDLVEDFFLWLGVNKITKITAVEDIVNQYSRHLYLEFIFEKYGKPANYRDTSLTYQKIENFDNIIKNITKEKSLVWFLNDDNIKQALSDYHEDQIKYAKMNEPKESFYHRIEHSHPSYINYQILDSDFFKGYLLGNKSLEKLVNKNPFTLENIPEEFLPKEEDIQNILIKIGAVEKFEDLSLETVVEVLTKLPEVSPKGKNTQTIYKECIKHYTKNKKAISKNSDIKLFGKKAKKKNYFNIEELYYNGNIKLPTKILDTVALLNYPKRGNTEYVTKFFGIKNLKSLKIEIDSTTLLKNDNFDNDFRSFVEKIHPFILAYRINNTEKDTDHKTAVQKLKKLNMEFCNHIQYRFNKIENELSHLEYISDNKDKNKFYVKIEKDDTLETLRKEFNFQELLADILGIIFDIEDVKDFRNLIDKDSNQIEQITQSDVGVEKLRQAKELLGIADEFYSFWNTIYRLKDMKLNNKFSKDSIDLIQKQLNFKTDVSQLDYANLSTNSACIILKELFTELQVSIKEFNEYAYHQVSFYNYHHCKLKQYLHDGEQSFKRIAYQHCLDKGLSKSFLFMVNQYESFENELSQEYNLEINVDYQSITNEFIITKIGVDYAIQEFSIDFEEIYQKQSCEVEIDELNLEQRSLLYFDGGLELIKKEIKDQNKQESQKITSKNKILPIIDSQLNLKHDNQNKDSKSNKGSVYSSTINKNKKAAGNKAEKLAYDSLVDEYGEENVEHISKRNDKAGYDIRYKDKGDIWKYVEVKTFSGNEFYISENEFEFAKNNTENYEIFLVSDDGIKKISIDFNNEENINKIHPAEYRVKYELLMQENQ